MDSLANADNQRVPFKVHITYDRIPTFIAKEKDYQDLQIDFANHQLEISKKDTLSIFYTTFFDSTEIKYAKTLQSDTLFYNYYHYFKAQTLLGSELSKTLIYNQYIGNKPILYSNEDYLRFFKSLCLPLVNKQLSKHTQAVEEAKSTYQVYEAFMKVLVREPLFKRKEVRSLALQLYCMRNELNSILSQQTKNGIINQMANFCLYPDQKLAAQYYQLNADRIEIGNEAPDFQLISTQGELKALTSYRKKIAYVGFINSKSTTCIRDLQVIDALKKKYKRVNFIFVICDRDSLQMGNLPQEANNLHYLFIDKNYSALETYEIWNFPVYYLLDKHGYFLQAPAKKPEQIIDDLRVLNMTKSERKRYEIIKE
jgi:peroxiredoxin